MLYFIHLKTSLRGECYRLDFKKSMVLTLKKPKLSGQSKGTEALVSLPDLPRAKILRFIRFSEKAPAGAWLTMVCVLHMTNDKFDLPRIHFTIT